MTTVWIAGASGLVGGELLSLLVSDPTVERVVAVARRPLAVTHDKLVSATVDFSDPSSFDALPAPSIAYACLGTTIKKAGSKEAFSAVDHDAVLTFAKAAHAKGARAFVHVSSLGADPKAGSFYLSVKGRAEESLNAIPFETVVALRPSILDGERAESRPLERAGLAVARALGPVLGKYKPTAASAVARKMVACASREGRSVVEANDIV